MPNSPSKLAWRSWTSLPWPFLITVAVVFCAVSITYAVVWMFNVRTPASKVELGFNKTHNEQYDAKTHSIFVGDVVENSPAERAGLRAGDRIIGTNGQPLITSAPYDEAYARGRPGDPVEFQIARAGVPAPLVLHGIFRARTPAPGSEGLARSSAQQILDSFPVLFLLVGFAVLFLRLDDRNAWLLALMFSGFAAGPTIVNPTALVPWVRTLVLAHRVFWNAMLFPFFYIFFAVFPVRSPLDKKLPWLKWVALAASAVTVVPGLGSGNSGLPAFVTQLIGDRASHAAILGLKYSLLALGILSLSQNSFAVSVPPEARRKSRVIFWGTVVGVLPIVLLRMAQDFAGYQPYFWVDTCVNIVLFLYPLSVAYSIVKHRVLEIPALLRRSVRYVLVQRGYFLLLFCGALLAILLFARFFSTYFAQNSQYGMALSAVFGVALVWVSGPFVKRGTDRIDRAFFRSSYDARVILQDLAEKTRTVTNRQELARLLELHITGALHPQSLACYLDAGDGNLVAENGPDSRQPPAISLALPKPGFPFRFGARFVLRETDTIPASTHFLAELARHGKAWDVPLAVSGEAGYSAALTPECLVPVLGRKGELIGLLVLGPRLSEEPYSGEDKDLLDSVASHSAIALENIRMAEQIANRLEADRRVAHEMQIAREVQYRLFPQFAPPLTTLEYNGSCIQARDVGGDYYDFLDLGSSNRLERGATRALPAAAWHLAFVLADISGKGIAGALLMANLQANLRSRYALALDDLPRLLKSVNQLFYENTPDDRYATLFFAVYDDHSREMEYANCGHNAPLLFRANGALERLAATSTVIGLFPEWQCITRRVTLAPGDVLVIYTDGVTEANDANGNEFGEGRLAETVRGKLTSPPADILTAIQQAVQNFSAGEQSDDLTLVVARAR